MNTLFSPLSFLFKMQIGWIVNIMTVITPSCREIRAMSWNWSKSSYCRNHLKMNLRLIHMNIVHNYIALKALPSTDYSNYPVASSQSLRRLFSISTSPSFFFFIIIFRCDHLMQKRPFQHQTLKVELSSDTRSYFFVANRLSSY